MLLLCYNRFLWMDGQIMLELGFELNVFYDTLIFCNKCYDSLSAEG
jgi:hypothetical protein